MKMDLPYHGFTIRRKKVIKVLNNNFTRQIHILREKTKVNHAAHIDFETFSKTIAYWLW